MRHQAAHLPFMAEHVCTRPLKPLHCEKLLKRSQKCYFKISLFLILLGQLSPSIHSSLALDFCVWLCAPPQLLLKEVYLTQIPTSPHPQRK